MAIYMKIIEKARLRGIPIHVDLDLPTCTRLDL